MHTKILHHLFRIASEDAIKAPLWDTAALGPSAFPNNAAFVHQQVSQLLTTSFSNLRPQQVEVGFFLRHSMLMTSPEHDVSIMGSGHGHTSSTLLTASLFTVRRQQGGSRLG